MILARTPLRITLGGGGTDLPTFTNHQTGFTLTATIDKYVYAALTPNFSGETWLKYSEIERLHPGQRANHRLFAALLARHPSTGIELTTMADIPAGTGLASSAACTLSTLAALRAHRRLDWATPHDLAAEAALIEMVDLGDPIGTQDPYACAVGGLLATHHHTNGMVTTQTVAIPEHLSDNLLLFWTGITHDSRHVLSTPPPYKALKRAHAIGCESYLALSEGDLPAFASLLTDQWTLKLNYQGGTNNATINDHINGALDHGALGAKLVGAGDGGFILAYSTDHLVLRDYMRKQGLREVRFSLTHKGTELLL